MKKVALALGATELVMTSAAAAHPGHGLAAGGWLHYATEPLHIAPLALVVLVLALAWRWRARARVPSR